MKSYRNEPTDGEPVVGSGPFQLVEGTAGGSTYVLGGQPRLLGRRPARRPGRVPGLQERGPRDPGADQGRGRLRRRHHPDPGRGAPGARRHPRPERRLAVLRGDRLQHRSGRPRDRRAARGRQPGAAGPGLPARPRLRARHRPAGRERLPGGRGPGRHVHPAGLRDLPLGAARGRGVHLRPRPRPASCSTRRATRSAPTGCARCRTAARSAPSGCSRATRRSAPRPSWSSSRSGSARSASRPRSA